jgi:hypothetical protein
MLSACASLRLKGRSFVLSLVALLFLWGLVLVPSWKSWN